MCSADLKKRKWKESALNREKKKEEQQLFMELRVYWKYCEYYFRIEYSLNLT